MKMVHMIGEAKHVPQVKVLINQTHPVGGVQLLVKTGIESVATDRWRAWYLPIIGNKDNITYLAAPPGGLSIERARALAQAAAAMQTAAVRVAIDQITEDTLKAQKAKDEIDKAVGNA